MTSTNEEEAVFDRQMRLWGADAQKLLRSARVLIRGKFQGFASELAKNLVLTGVNVTIQDDELVTDEDLLANIFLRKEDVGQPRAAAALPRLQEMNPFAQVRLFDSDNKLAEALQDYVVIVSVNEPIAVVTELAATCRRLSKPLIYCHCAGMLLLSILDVGPSYIYSVEGKPEETKQISFPSLSEVLEFHDWNTLPTGRKAISDSILGFFVFIESQKERSENVKEPSPKRSKSIPGNELSELVDEFTKKLPQKSFKDAKEMERAAKIYMEGKSFPPINTIGGGLIGQEVLKLVTRQAEPVKNVILLDGKDASAVVRTIPPSSTSS